jgi:type I restriction enzyme S subunit
MSTVKLADCCTILSGGTPDKGKVDYWRGTIPWFSPKDIKRFDLTRAQDSISEAAARDSATRIVDAGAILVVIRSGILAHTFPVGVLRQRSAFNQDIKALIPRDGYDPDYLALWLQANQARVVEHGVKRGPTVHSLIADYLEELQVPQLPIEKQCEAAARLKHQLAEVETARQAAQAQLHEIEALPARLLAQAFGYS